MRGAQPQQNSVRVTPLPHTGPVSRIVRLLLAAFVAWMLVEWVSAGLTWFSQPATLRNPWVWFVTAAAVYYGLYQTVASGFSRPWAGRVVVAFAIVFAATSTATLISQRELWAAPLTALLYGLDVGMLALAVIALLASIVLGTPGCDIGALGQLIRRLRGASDPEDVDSIWCVVGLNRLDEWEARQPWHREH